MPQPQQQPSGLEPEAEPPHFQPSVQHQPSSSLPPVSASVAVAFFADRSIEYSETYAAFQIGVSQVLGPISQALGQGDLFGWVWSVFQWVSTVVGFFSAMARIWPAIRRLLGPEPVTGR